MINKSPDMLPTTSLCPSQRSICSIFIRIKLRTDSTFRLNRRRGEYKNRFRRLHHSAHFQTILLRVTCIRAFFKQNLSLRKRAPKGGGVWGGGVPLPSRLGGLGERRKLPRGVRCGAPAANEFVEFYRATSHL